MALQLRTKVDTLRHRHGHQWIHHLDHVDLLVAARLPPDDPLRLQISAPLTSTNPVVSSKPREMEEEECCVPVAIPIGKGASVTVWVPRNML